MAGVDSDGGGREDRARGGIPFDEDGVNLATTDRSGAVDVAVPDEGIERERR